MNDGIKQALIWATMLLVSIFILVTNVAGCTERQGIRQQQFASACIQKGSKYIPAGPDYIGTCV